MSQPSEPPAPSTFVSEPPPPSPPPEINYVPSCFKFSKLRLFHRRPASPTKEKPIKKPRFPDLDETIWYDLAFLAWMIFIMVVAAMLVYGHESDSWEGWKAKKMKDGSVNASDFNMGEEDAARQQMEMWGWDPDCFRMEHFH